MANKRGRRNPKSQEIRNQWQAARQFVQEQAFFDGLKGESVCLATVDDVAFHLALKFGEPVPEAVPNVERGLVLTNQRGERVFQLIEL
ncbi:MAG: hypothetical protein ABR909_07565 [Candidatus Bathyarchaeia archaeon]|jgi:hypothetical protein